MKQGATGRNGSARALAIAFLLAACATPSKEEHGFVEKGLVPVDVPTKALDAAHAPKRVALLIGNGRYDDPEWRPLRYTQKDASDLARVLSERGKFTDVVTLRDATRDGILRALERLADSARDERDTVVLYVSSHGTLARDGRGQLRRYLVTRDTKMSDIPGTALALDELKGRFDALHSRRKVLVLAACHSGGGKSLLPAEIQHELTSAKAGFLVRPLEEVSRASVVLAAADWGETALEDTLLENDVYTHYLVEALQLGADRNGDGAVTVSEAHDYARRMTYEYTQGRQRPTAESTEVGADPIVLVGQVRRKGRPELYSYAPSLDGFTVNIDGRPLADLPGGVAVDAGRHRVQIAKGSNSSILDLPVNFAPGERIEVEELFVRADPRLEIAPRVAVLGFLDGGNDVMGSVVGVGATLTARGWPARNMAIRFDLVGSTGASQVASVQGEYTAFTAGVAFPWRFPMLMPGFSLLAGPRLSAVYLERRLNVQIGGGPQSYFVLTPGLLFGFSHDLSRRVSIGVEAQVDWALLRVDGQSRSSVFGELLMGAGYRF